MNAVEPEFHTDGIIHLRAARHPLLDPKHVVPIDLTLGKDYNLLIVTGPNTGGKTVSLKTCGLLSLMGQAGLHIPTRIEASYLYLMMSLLTLETNRVLNSPSRLSPHI